MRQKQLGFGWFREAARKAAWLALAAGIIFSPILGTGVTRAQSFSVLYNFGLQPDGIGPSGNLIADSTGNLYGETTNGGTYGWGTIFELPASGGETVLYNFTGGSDGGEPYGGLALEAAGNLVGTTLTGGKLYSGCRTTGCGVVFRLSPQGTLQLLHSFTGGPDGGDPQAGLVLGQAGNLYGTTSVGGLSGGCGGAGCGVAFKINLQGRETILHTFTGVPDGASPLAPLLPDSAGNLYGTTAVGGFSCAISTEGCGTVFKLDSTGNETVLYSFTGQEDGAGPAAGLIRDGAGNLYGTTTGGGDFAGGVCVQLGCGVVFELESGGTENALYAFTDGSDGAVPETSLVRDAKGNLYGSTPVGGSNNSGVIFKLTATGRLDVLHSFGGADGSEPSSSLLVYKGHLYGTTVNGGNFGGGVVFRLQP